jgi:hypothetical protein
MAMNTYIGRCRSGPRQTFPYPFTFATTSNGRIISLEACSNQNVLSNSTIEMLFINQLCERCGVRPTQRLGRGLLQVFYI